MQQFRVIVLLALGAASAAPLCGQDFQPRRPAEFNMQRPDSRAPAGVLFDHLVPAGRFRIAYNFTSIENDGLFSGGQPALSEDVLEIYPTAAVTLKALSHDLNFGYGVTEDLTLLALVPFVHSKMGNLTRAGEAFFTESSGVGDVRLVGLYRLYASNSIVAHLEGGVSAPTGSITEEDVTPTSAPGTGQLPYAMQAGSGTFDLYPGLTIHVMNDVGSVGAQVRGTFRLGENDRGYRLGDRVMATAWMSPRINDYLSLSGRIVVSNWDGISGFDPSLDPSQMPSAVSTFTGGMTVEVPFGLNVHMAEGPLRGHRMGLEASFPVHQDYDGIQLERSWTLLAYWGKLF